MPAAFNCAVRFIHEKHVHYVQTLTVTLDHENVGVQVHDVRYYTAYEKYEFRAKRAIAASPHKFASNSLGRPVSSLSCPPRGQL